MLYDGLQDLIEQHTRFILSNSNKNRDLKDNSILTIVYSLTSPKYLQVTIAGRVTDI